MVVTQVYMFVKTLYTVPFEYVHFIVHKLYFNKADFNLKMDTFLESNLTAIKT